MSFSLRLKLLRKERNLTQAKTATLINVNERTFQSYEAGEFEPALPTIIRIADLFDVSIDYLVGRTNDPRRF